MTSTINHQPSTHRNRPGIALAAMAVAIGLTLPAHAITYTATLDQVQTSFDRFTDQFLTPSVVPLITSNFEADKTFAVRLEAPAGQKINVAPPAEFPLSRSLTLDLISGPGPFFGAPPVQASDLVFENLMGPGPSPITHLFHPSDAGTQFRAFSSASFTGDFSFTAVTATFTVPGSFNVDMMDQIPTRVRLRFEAGSGGRPGDPGQWVTFMDVAPPPPPPPGGGVPEPITATLGLISLAALGYTTKRRRHA